MNPISRSTPHDVARPATRESLVDVLDRVLDKGVVIAGDISVNLLDIELLTIKVRLLIASVDKAREMGIDWWQHDPQLTGQKNVDSAPSKRQVSRLEEENRSLRERIERLEATLNRLSAGPRRAVATEG